MVSSLWVSGKVSESCKEVPVFWKSEGEVGSGGDGRTWGYITETSMLRQLLVHRLLFFCRWKIFSDNIPDDVVSKAGLKRGGSPARPLGC